MEKKKNPKTEATKSESVNAASNSQNGGVLLRALKKVLIKGAASTSPTKKHVKNTSNRPELSWQQCNMLKTF